MRVRRNPGNPSNERGTALLMIAVVTTGLMGLSFGLVAITHASAREQRADKEDVRAQYVCQAGLANAVFELRSGRAGALGTAENPVAWGAARYWIARTDPSPDLVRLEATGIEHGSGARAELLLRRVPNTPWRFGAFGRDGLSLGGRARVDSYDSNLGTYASQAVNGGVDAMYAGSNGDIGSNAALTLDHDATVWGDATGGPAAGTTVLGSAVVSGTTSALASTVELPHVELPRFAEFGAWDVNAEATLPASDRSYSALTVSADQTLHVVGPARLVVSDLVVESGGSIEIDSSSGPVEIWVAHGFSLGSHASIAPLNAHARDFALNLLGDNVADPDGEEGPDAFEFGSGSKLVAMVHAPHAELEFDGDFELFGALLALSAEFRGDTRVHFDEDLLAATAAAQPLFETVCWRDLPYVLPAAGGAAP